MNWVRRHRRLTIAGAIAVGAVLAAAAAWLAAPGFVGDPMAELRRHTPVRRYIGGDGETAYLERTYDWEWRFPVTLAEISPAAIRVMLAAEDENFYRHHGVDYAAICRAALQNLRNGRIVSGASTITMQLAGMAEERTGRRNIFAKLRQAAAARKLERLYSKDEILTEYLNRIPMGGKLYGIESAAQGYFGLPARELNTAESALLCGLPQRPNYYRPDRHPERARKRQKVVLHLLEKRNKLTRAEADFIENREPLRYRDFTRRARFEVAARPDEFTLFFRAAAQEAGADAERIPTAFQPEIARGMLHILRRQRDAMPGVGDAAAVLLDSRTGAVVASVGTLDYTENQVDLTRAVRSAGSALKPFFYAEAIAGGMMVRDTILTDAPLRYGRYAPGNYDGKYLGDIRAAEALARSLNTPAVRILAMLGETRALALFRNAGLLKQAPREEPGLSLALGTAGHTLLDIANSYRIFAGDGCWSPVRFTQGGAAAERIRVFPRGAARMTAAMLRLYPLPRSTVDAAWKTGTSNNNRDAWCFAFTPDYTVGVWAGNRDGSRADALVGAEAAAPAAGEILSLIYRDRRPTPWPPEAEDGEMMALCAASGLAPGARCLRRESHPTVRGIPLRRCDRCGMAAAKTAAKPRIQTPLPRRYHTGRGESVRLPLQGTPGGGQFFINGQPAAEEAVFGIGRHTITYLTGAESTSVEISVEK